MALSGLQVESILNSMVRRKSTMGVEARLESEVRCTMCGAQAVIVTPTGRAYCESCVAILYGLRISRRCTYCGKELNPDVISDSKGDMFCSIGCAVNQRWEESK